MDADSSSNSSPVRNFSSHFKIRRATKMDVPSIAKMIKGLAEFLGQPEKLKIGELELLRDGFGKTRLFHCIVAEEVRHFFEGERVRLGRRNVAMQKDQEILGMVIYFFTYSTWEGSALYVEDIFVLPMAREQGIGRALMEAVSKVANLHDCCRIQWVSPCNKRTQRFYMKLGAISMPEWLLFRMDKKQIEELSSRNVLNNDVNCEKEFLKMSLLDLENELSQEEE